MLNVDWAFFNACATGRTRPQHVIVDDGSLARGVTNEWNVDDIAGVGFVHFAQQKRTFGVHVVAQVLDQHFGREWFAGVPGGTLRLAAATFGAGLKIEELVDREMFDRADTKDRVFVHRFKVNQFSGEFAERFFAVGVAGEFLEDDGDDMQVLAVQGEDQERPDDAQVNDEVCGGDPLQGEGVHADKHFAEHAGDERGVGGGVIFSEPDAVGDPQRPDDQDFGTKNPPALVQV